MARPIWRGSISFGLVNVAVSAHAAVRDHDVHFHQLRRGTGERIHHRKVVEGSSKEVDADDIELGFEISKGRYVTFDPDEIAALRPASTRSIDITDFVALADIDPIYYERTYWLVPDDRGERAYQLLLAAMESRERVGIGSVVMRTKQYLAAVRPLQTPQAEQSPQRELLGPCCGGVVLQQLEEGTDQEAHLSEPRSRAGRYRQLHRECLQSHPTARPPRRRQPRAG